MGKRTAILLSVLFLVSFLAGCGPKPVQPEPSMPAPEAFPTTEATEPSSPTPETEATPAPSAAPETTQAPTTEPVATEAPATEPEAASTVPYTLSLHGFVSIFDSPSYDGIYVQAVGQDGVYTIVEEQADGEGNLWGKLKSGVGWVCLTELDAELPVSAGLADTAILQDPHLIVIVDDSEFMEYLVFRANETLTDVRLTSLLPDVGGYTEDCTYDTFPQLTPEKPLVAEVVFYGDFTTYGLSFTDESGTQRHFALYISGRNGAPVLQEYTP